MVKEATDRSLRPEWRYGHTVTKIDSIQGRSVTQILGGYEIEKLDLLDTQDRNCGPF